MKNINQYIRSSYPVSYYALILTLMVCMSLFTSCLEDDLAFDIVESPVLAVFESPVISGDLLTMTGAFYELDKSGILDSNIGIDSTLLTNLSLSVYVNGDVLIDEVVTDTNGDAIFSAAVPDLQGSRTLEWVGEHAGIPFRIMKNF